MDFQLISTLYRIILKHKCESLIDLVWQYEQSEEVKNFYDKYKKDLFLEEEIFETNNKIIESNRLRIINLCFYMKKNTIPELLKTNDHNIMSKNIHQKIKSFKINWKNLVEKHLKEGRNKKYILKHFYTKKKDYLEEINIRKGKKNKKIIEEIKKQLINEFSKPILEVINDWVEDENSLLSEFYYIEDLQKNQINVILTLEPIYIILNSDEEDKKILFDCIKKNKNYCMNQKNNGGQVPNLLLKPDGIFRVDPIEIIDKSIFSEDEKEVTTVYKNDNCELKITVPKTYKNTILNREFDYSKDVIPHGKYEMAVIVGILQLGREQLKTSNKISFTFNQLIKIWGLTPGGYIYKRIKDALFYLMLNIYTVQLPNDRVRHFHIINSINRPQNTSSGELEWTVVIDDELGEQIRLLNYTELYSEDIVNFKYELSPILFKILVIDRSELTGNLHKNILPRNSVLKKEYTLNEISSRTFLSGKPSIRKNKILNSLKEIFEKENSIIKYYEVNKDKDRYTIVFNT